MATGGFGVAAMSAAEARAFIDEPDALMNTAKDSEPGESESFGPLAGMMTSAEAIKRFVTAGKAYFTLVSKVSGARYTFKVTRAKDNPAYRNPFPTYFVSVLSGPDNTSSYLYAGMLQNTNLGWRIRQTRGSRVSSGAKSYQAVDWYLSRVLNGRAASALAQVEFIHAGRCGRCGRMLTVPESVEIGLGPECAGKV